MPKKLCLQRTFMMQLTTLSSQPHPYYVVPRPIKDKLDVNLLILDKWDQLGTNCKFSKSSAFKEPSRCSWQPFPAHHNHIMWFWDLLKTSLMSLCPYETSETSWVQIVNAQKAMPSKNLHDAVDDSFQPTPSILCGSETYKRQARCQFAHFRQVRPVGHKLKMPK